MTSAVIGVHRGAAAVTLRAGELEATFLPDEGMVGASLRHRGDELLTLPGGLAAYRKGHTGGLPLLAPWANRLGRRRFRVAGVDVDLEGLPLHADGNGLPIHGTMTARAGWEIVRAAAGPEDGTAALEVRFDYGAHPELLAAFPFPHELRIHLRLAPESLTVATTVSPTTEQPVPVAFGWHPYFRLPGAPRSAWRLRLPRRDHLALDAQGLPNGSSTPEDAENELIGSRTFDDLYGLHGPERPGQSGGHRPEILALEGGGRRVGVAYEEGYPFAQVFVPPGKEFACLEAMTAPTNSLVTGNCPLVQPGRAMTARFAVTVTSAGS